MAIIDYMALGKVGYEAYRSTITGIHQAMLETWTQLPLTAQQAWQAAALAISTETIKLMQEDDHGN
jgi:hypothetical protein